MMNQARRWRQGRFVGVTAAVAAAAVGALIGTAPPALGQDGGDLRVTPVAPKSARGGALDQKTIDAAIAQSVEMLVAMQEDARGVRASDADEKAAGACAQWPYEGVYRVGGEIPVGYRIGGTSICAVALMRAPGYDQNEGAKRAVAKAAAFVEKELQHKLMNPDYEGGYDVRGWGYTYGLQFMLALMENDGARMPEGFAEKAKAAARWCVSAIEQTEIPQVGGWNYARAPGKNAVSPPSPFMTGPTLQALFEARRQGLTVNDAVVERGLKCLERARTKTGSVVYSGVDGEASGEAVAGSVGRMLVSETTLALAGRSTPERVRGSIDAFFTHWEWLEKRRRQNGTHVAPFGIAPYYFFYAHYYAAQAIETLPRADRGEYRRKLAQTLFGVREQDGTWNDRVFDRSANYGTAMAMMALNMKNLPKPAPWGGAQVKPGEPDGARTDASRAGARLEQAPG